MMESGCRATTRRSLTPFVVVVLVSCVVLNHQARALFLGKNTEDYLTKFGYLPQSDMETGAQRTEEQLSDAVRNLQFFAGLNVTGQIDRKTLDLMAKPRCGVPDVTHNGYRNRRSADAKRSKRYTLQGQRWSRTHLTWNLKTFQQDSNLDRESVRWVLATALGVWAQQTALKFTEVGPSDKTADLQVHFFAGFHGDGYPFDGRGSVLAHAFFPGGGRGGDVHFDTDEIWLVDEDERYSLPHDQVHAANNLLSVAVHEFGHSLGLGHSSVEGSVMFPWYSHKITHGKQLPNDDLLAIQHLYGKATEWDLLPKTPKPPIIPTEKPKERPSTTEATVAVSEEPTVINRCNVRNFDAVAVIRSELWIFSDNKFWRLGSEYDSGQRSQQQQLVGQEELEFPVEMSAFWYGLPASALAEAKIDAVYERPDHKIVFFVGKKYYVMHGNTRLHSGPFPLTNLGLPANLDRVDGALRWGWNDKTYFFSGSMYWRYDEVVGHVELDYPRDISVWSGVPENIDSVFKYFDGKTYFFKGRKYWKFDDLRMKVHQPPPLTHPVDDSRDSSINVRWLHCPPRELIQDPFREGATVASLASSKPVISAYLVISAFYVTVMCTHFSVNYIGLYNC